MVHQMNLEKKNPHILMNDLLVVYFFSCNCPFLQGAGGPRGPPGGRGPPGEGLPGPKVPAPNHSKTDNQKQSAQLSLSISRCLLSQGDQGFPGETGAPGERGAGDPGPKVGQSSHWW